MTGKHIVPLYPSHGRVRFGVRVWVGVRVKVKVRVGGCAGLELS